MKKDGGMAECGSTHIHASRHQARSSRCHEALAMQAIEATSETGSDLVVRRKLTSRMSCEKGGLVRHEVLSNKKIVGSTSIVQYQRARHVSIDQRDRMLAIGLSVMGRALSQSLVDHHQPFSKRSWCSYCQYFSLDMILGASEARTNGCYRR